MATLDPSCDLFDILKEAGMIADGEASKKGEVRIKKWDWNVVANLDQLIESRLGSRQEGDFMRLASDVADLSPQGFLAALREFEKASYVWDPVYNPAQRTLCEYNKRVWGGISLTV